MITELNETKIAKNRLINMYATLAEGKALYKAQEAVKFNCSLRSIQRDIEDLRSFFANQSEITGAVQELIYDRKMNAYRLVPPLRNLLSNEETFAVLKILLESRSLTEAEMFPILQKLISCCVPADKQKQVNELIANEKFHYIEPRHKSNHRIDRIKEYTITDKHFYVPYQNRFEEGEFRKRVQFMYGGKLQKIKFWYKGPSVEAVLDRLPTAEILQRDGKGYLISAEVFGKGIDMWLRSQGDMVEAVK